MKCSRCGMEYGVVHNYCNNCGMKLKRTGKIKFFNGYRKYEYLLLLKNIPGFKVYILLLFSIVFSFFTGWFCAEYGAGSLFLNRLSFFLYITGSLLLLAWFILRYSVVYKLLYQSKTNDAVNPALTVFLLMVPFFGFVWHFLVYFKWSLRELEHHDPFVFFLYSLLNVLIFIPGFSIYFFLPYIVADIYVHKIIYSRI
ncbi:MAG: hypothetical protein A2015_13540 [Spirochaetes bacterium GWF1_31_7]|nr:MAG: hypothetical protein A2Y30_11285 [Spirochaetes bacterium GWE1_32_154]OHD47932.1 MAG: hypothetical protein A2Y29_08105 [Spirochaetes bacterium GWE2_31_10]OHD49843.1 MAG: hypothetical protein A2015_13540 [Spirochaetes bacterium GWF1_31_7]HBD92909.1 hypothetical protein [Spirochaetia bacterium]HBI37786.1 hypothetical protein [Spirochaetia bacterium]